MNCSRQAEWKRQILLLLFACGIVYLSIELIARYLVPHISQIESRTAAEDSAARSIARSADGRHTLLLLGNSLLRTAVDLPLLHAGLAPNWSVRRYVVESTNYIDWYYGIRGLLESGSAPDAIALMLNVRQFLSDDIRDTYSAYRLFSAADTVRAGIRAGKHPTEIASLLIGHFSAYYGLRLEIRKYAFQKIVPESESLTRLLLAVPSTEKVSLERVETKGLARLRELGGLCKKYVVRCIFVVPPEMNPPEIRSWLVTIAEAEGFASARFDLTQQLPSHYFEPDHFHFSEQGATAYTSHLVRSLQGIL